MTISSTKARPRDQLVSSQIGNSNLQVKSITLKNVSAIETEQGILKVKAFKY